MSSQSNGSHLRHEIDNALLALEALIDELKDQGISEEERNERIKEIDEYSKKLQKDWNEYKKSVR